MIRIILPWPPSETSANASGQGKWRAKSTAASKYKTTCAWIIRAAGVKPMPARQVSVRVTFNPTSRTSRYDLDNLIGRAKQGLDAVSEAIGIDDSQWQEMTLRRGVKGGQGSIVVEVLDVAPDAVAVPIVGQIT
jgi:crossover junction endodeoxyribonuclease RusA